MTRDMNLAGDGKLDYFFNQWVYGTDIPDAERRSSRRRTSAAVSTGSPA